MTKQEIQNKLRQNHQKFADLVVSLNDHDFLHTENDKWTAGQQLDHICRSVAALNKGLAFPKFIIGLYAGKANRPSKDYDALVAKYKLRLEAGGKRPQTQQKPYTYFFHLKIFKQVTEIKGEEKIRVARSWQLGVGRRES